MPRLIKSVWLSATLLGLLLVGPALAQQTPGCSNLDADDAAWLDCTTPFADQAIEDVRILSADDMEGRGPDTPGSAKARAYIVERFTALGLVPLFADFEQTFAFESEDRQLTGANVVGVIPGTAGDDQLIVVTAHYDHFGIRDGQIYNGADDNASGVAGLLAVAAALSAEPPLHTTVFAVVDGEELGFFGSLALVRDTAFPIDDVGVNLNLDMISKNANGELFAVGGYQNTSIRALIGTLVRLSPVTLLQGHDSRSNDGRDDWTEESDQYAFQQLGIPWLYLGVEDHAEYHQPTDDFDTIPLPFFRGSVATAVAAFRVLDKNFADITPPDTEDD